jgi:hypothetical protein
MGKMNTLSILMENLRQAAAAYAGAQERYRAAYDTLRDAGVRNPNSSSAVATFSDDLMLVYAELLAADDAKVNAFGDKRRAEEALAEAVSA